MKKREEQHSTVYTKLLEITKSDKETLYILFKYAPDLMPTPCKTIEELKKNYVVFANADEATLKKYELRSDVQRGIRWLLIQLDSKRDIELYNKYYDLAMSGDVQALKAYIDFKKILFADEEKDELSTILSKANIPEDEDELEMEI